MAGVWLALACGGAAWGVTPAMDWTVTYTQTTGGTENYLASTTDPSGNTYLIYEDLAFQTHLAVMDPTGATTFNGPLPTAGLILAAAYDPAGHVVVAGLVGNPQTGFQNIYAEQYDLAGNLLWSRSIPSPSDQWPSGVAVDSLGNVDIAGFDDLASPNLGLAAQIDSVGDPATWVQTISFTTNDFSQAVAVDGANNVYVAGVGVISADVAIEPTLTMFDVTGVQQYAQHYFFSSDFTAGQAVVVSGADVYVGTSDYNLHAVGLIQADAATGGLINNVTYADANFDQVGGMAVDSAGNIAIAASTNTNAGDVLGLLYDTTLTLVGGFPVTWDSLGVDAGLSFNQMPNVRVGADGSGNLYFSTQVVPPTACQGEPQNVAVIKVDNTGVQQWARVFDVPPAVTTAGMVTDANGSYYVALAYGLDASVLKYDPAGNFLWRADYLSPNLCPTGVGGIGYFGGNIYLAVVGHRMAAGGGTGVEVAKFSSAGVQTGAFPWDVSPDEYGPKLTTDSLGNVLIALSTTTYGISVAKMTPAGAISWQYAQQFSPADIVTGIGRDSGNAVYVTGPYPNNVAGYSTARILKLTAGGAFSLTQTLSGVVGQFYVPHAVQIAQFPAGVYLAGYEDDGSGNLYGRLDRIGTGGNILWTATAGGSPSEVWNGVTTGDCASDVFVTGSAADLTLGGWDQILRTFSAGGGAGWATVYDNGVVNETGEGVAVGSAYVAGNSGTSAVRLTKYTDTNLHALSGAIAFNPNPAEAWQWFKVTMTVTNTANETINNLTPFLNLDGGPVAFQAAVTPATVGALAKCSAATFTWTYTATGFGVATFTTTVTGSGAISGSVVVEAVTGSVTIVPPAKLTASIYIAPTPVFYGNIMTVSVTVSNTGGVTAAAVIPVLGEVSGTYLVTPLTGPLPPGPVTLAAGTGTTFVWTLSASGTGVVRFSFTASGADIGGTPFYQVSGAAAASVTLQGTAGLLTDLTGSNNPASLGQVVRVILTVSNTGSTTALAVSSTLVITSGAGLVALVSGPVPGGTVLIQAGSATAFVWTYTTTGVGTVAFSATAVGLDAGILGLALQSATAMTLVIGTPAVLESALSMTPAPTVVGQGITVALTVTNVGGANALNLLPSLHINAGAGLVTLVGGPSPPIVPALAPGTSTTFVWTYTATARGVVTMSATASGSDAFAGAVVSGSTATTTLYDQARLFLSATLPMVATVGMTFTLTATVSNTGEDAAVNVLPIAGWFSGIADVNFLTSPALVPVTLTPGSTTVYSWLLQAVQCGVPEIGAVAVGTDTATGTAIDSGSLTLYHYPISIQYPATLSASLWWVASTTGTQTGTGGFVVRQGDTFTVNLRVTDTVCGSNISGLGASRLAWTGTTGGVVRTGGPGNPVTLASGGAKVFKWTYQAMLPDMVNGYTFSATLTGTDANFGVPMLAGARVTLSGTMLEAASATFAVSATVYGISTSVFVEPWASVTLWASSSPGTVKAGTPVTFTLTVSNTGDDTAANVVPAIVPSSLGGGVITAGPTPAAGGIIPPHGTVTYVWTVVPATSGSLALQATVAAVDAATGLPATGATTAAAPVVTVMPRPDGDLVVYPNPVNLDRFHIYLKLNADASGVTVDVYDAAIHRVFGGTWGFVAQVDGVLDVDGASHWAPGVYLVRARATLADGTLQTFPAGKVVIKR